MFLGDYLTSQGQPGEADRAMSADAGFVIEGLEEPALPVDRRDLVIARHRGAGTTTPPTPNTLINSDREVN